MLLARLRRSHIHVVIARHGVVDDPTKNHRHSQRSWHPPEEQRAARTVYESYETSFVIRNDFDSFPIQPV